MKQNKYVALLLVFTLLFCASCTKPPMNEQTETTTSAPQEEIALLVSAENDRPYPYNTQNGMASIKYSDDLFYFYSLRQSLLKYNPKTGYVTTVCTDPICDHRTENCLLYGLNTVFYIHNNNVLFQRDYTKKIYKNEGDRYPAYTERYSGFCAYDTVKADLEVYENNKTTSNGGASSGRMYVQELYVGNSRYYYEYQFNEKLNKYVYAICRLNLDTKEKTVFDSEANGVDNMSVFLLCCINDRIYFSDLKSIYSTNLDLADKKTVAEGTFPKDMTTDGKRLFWEVENQDKSNTIYSMSIDGGEISEVKSGVNSWFVTQEYLYYTIYDEKYIGQMKNSDGTFVDQIAIGSEMYRCGHDGTGDELVWTDTGKKYECMRLNYWLVIGNYLYATYTQWTDVDNDGIYLRSNVYISSGGNFKVMKMNIMKGEVEYLSAP